MSYPKLKLKKNEDRRILAGHLWVFSNEVDTKSTPLNKFEPGEIVTVTSQNDRPLANAYINPHSLISARVFSHSVKQALDNKLITARISQALSLRQECFAEPYYRMIYSEGDLLPGVIVDRYNDTLVLQVSTLGMEVHQDDIVQALKEVVQPATIILNNNTSARKQEGMETYSKVIEGDAPDTIQIDENNARFHVPAMGGQKTGWFYDHRANRQAMQTWVKEKQVLDVFSYAGGWGIQAALAGASQVHCIETSETACELILANAELNGVNEKLSIGTADAFEALAALKQEGKKFDVIILDPPAFIKRKKDLKQGTIAYQRLNKLAMQLLPVNGILISASCSFHLSREQHLKILRTSAQQTGYQLQIVEQGGLGPDHPIHPAIAETAYLSCFTVRLLR